MILTTCLLFCLSLTSETKELPEDMSISITANEVDEETIQVELMISGRQTQALVLHDPAQKTDLYIAATDRVSGFMDQVSGFENPLQIEEIAAEELDRYLNIVLPKADFPKKVLEISVTRTDGRPVTFSVLGLLDFLGETTIIGLGAPPKELTQAYGADSCDWWNRRDCGDGAALRMYAASANCGLRCTWCCLSPVIGLRTPCINLFTCEAICPPCIQVPF